VSANIVVDVDFERSYLSFPAIKVGETSNQVMAILAKDPSSLVFGKVTTNVPGLEAKLVKGENEGKVTWSLNAKFRGDKVGVYNGTINVEVTKPVEKELHLSVSARVEGDIQVSPPVLSLRKTSDNTQPQAKVKVFTEKGSFKIIKIIEETKKVTAEVKTVTAGREYEITAQITKEAEQESNFSTKIILNTNSSKQPQIEIPVYYYSNPPPFKPSTPQIVPNPKIKPAIPHPLKIH